MTLVLMVPLRPFVVINPVYFVVITEGTNGKSCPSHFGLFACDGILSIAFPGPATSLALIGTFNWFRDSQVGLLVLWPVQDVQQLS